MIRTGVLLSIICFVAVPSENAWESLKDNSEEMQEDKMAVEASAAKRKIISYNKALMSEKEIQVEERRLKAECNCEVEHLKSAGAFILTFASAAEKMAKDLKLEGSIEAAADDEVMGIFHEL